jgi:SagB-type dehydrogenase family enzyme
MAHGITGKSYAGPVPSAGGLQALELYLGILHPGWLPPGIYHYDRIGHFLSQIAAEPAAGMWERAVPSLQQVQGGSVLWLLIGDGARVKAKYSERGLRFLLLEAGHLMQNICLLSASLGWVTMPLGGFFERDIARRLQLPRTDVVLYTGVSGAAPSATPNQC